MAYISITGLRVKSLRHWPRFIWHAVRSMGQAKKTEGCLKAEARMMDGVQHTMSVWTDRKAMLNFMMRGPHREAMRDFRNIATGSTYGFEADHAPDWAEAQRLWRERAKEY